MFCNSFANSIDSGYRKNLIDSSYSHYNKKAYAPLYSQKYGLSLDAPFRYSNNVADAYNIHDADTLVDIFNRLFTPDAKILKKIYHQNDPLALEQYEKDNCSVVQFDELSEYYEYNRQFMAAVPDGIFKVVSFQSTQTATGQVVILIGFDYKGTVTQIDAASKCTEHLDEYTKGNDMSQAEEKISTVTSKEHTFSSMDGPTHDALSVEEEESITTLNASSSCSWTEQEETPEAKYKQLAPEDEEEEATGAEAEVLDYDGNKEDEEEDAGDDDGNSSISSITTCSTLNDQNHNQEAEDEVEEEEELLGERILLNEEEAEAEYITQKIITSTKPIHLVGYTFLFLNDMGHVKQLEFRYQICPT